MKKAFTLIELLVVVLIIGILAAIALPQYQVAVTKSQMTQLMIATRAIKDAEEVYYLANGTYTNTLSNLDVAVSQQCNVSDDANGALVRCWFPSSGNDKKMMLQWHFDHQQKAISWANRRRCYAYNSVADQVCASFGATTTGNPREGSSTTARIYDMP